MSRCIIAFVALVLLLGSTFPNVSSAGPGSRGVLTQVAGTLILTTPDPPNITVTPCDDLNGIFLAPHLPEALPASLVRIEVRNSDNFPIENAQVVVELAGNHRICPGVTLTSVTDENGIAYLETFGGGCAMDLPVAGIIKANGVTIRAYENVRSPDFDGTAGDLVLDLADLIAFSGEFLGGAGGCHDYDDSALTDLGDLILFSPAFSQGNHCP